MNNVSLSLVHRDLEQIRKIFIEEKNISSVCNNDNDRIVVANSKRNDYDLLFDLEHSPHLL